MKINEHFLKLTIPTHLLLLLSFFFISYSWIHLLGILIFWILIGGYGVAVGYHRYFAHRSFKTSKFVERILAYLGLMSGDGSLIFWVALHQGIHHKYADKPQDMHSPIHGKWNAFLYWQRNINKNSINLMYARQLLKDGYIVFLHDYYYWIYWLTVAVVAFFSLDIALGMLIPASILSHHQDNLVNVVGHLRSTGYRNYDTNDNSVNNWFTGLLVWGQGWHNNHHAVPNQSNFGGVNWWEFDSADKILIPLIRQKK